MMDLGQAQTPQVKTILAILGSSLVVAVLDSVRRRKAPKVQPEVSAPPPPAPAVQIAVVEPPLPAMQLPTTAPVEPVSLMQQVRRVSEPALICGEFMPLPKPRAFMPRDRTPLKISPKPIWSSSNKSYASVS